MTARVLVLAPEAFGGRGGIAQYVRDLAEALASMPGVEAVHVLPRTATEEVPELPEGVEQHPPRPGKLDYARGALALARRIGPTVVLSAHLYTGPLGALAARIAGARLMVALWGIEVWERPGLWRRKALDRANLALAISRDTRAKTLAWSRLPPERIGVVANTVGPQFVPGDRAGARRRFGLKDDEFALLAVGRLSTTEQYKGQDTVIRALRDIPLSADGRTPIYLIAGDGDDRARLEALATEMEVADRVRFIGYVPMEDLPDLYRAADLFAMPSTGEGFGFVFLEAMACGTPAIGVAVAGARDALGDGTLGWAPLPEDFATTLAAAIDAPPPNREALAAAVRERFGAAAFRDTLADLWNRMARDTAAG